MQIAALPRAGQPGSADRAAGRGVAAERQLFLGVARANVPRRLTRQRGSARASAGPLGRPEAPGIGHRQGGATTSLCAIVTHALSGSFCQNRSGAASPRYLGDVTSKAGRLFGADRLVAAHRSSIVLDIEAAGELGGAAAGSAGQHGELAALGFLSSAVMPEEGSLLRCLSSSPLAIRSAMTLGQFLAVSEREAECFELDLGC